jgi:hypothetical protein
VTLHPTTSPRLRTKYKRVFGLCAALAIFLVALQAYRSNKSSERIVENLDVIKGDTETIKGALFGKDEVTKAQLSKFTRGELIKYGILLTDHIFSITTRSLHAQIETMKKTVTDVKRVLDRTSSYDEPKAEMDKCQGILRSTQLSAVNEYNARLKTQTKLLRAELLNRLPPDERISIETGSQEPLYDYPANVFVMMEVGQDLLRLLIKLSVLQKGS